jgi:ADP-ribosylglycohydrolase
MLGAIAGDIIGSVFEGNPHKSTQFPLFGPLSGYTDDTVLTIAVAQVLLDGGDYVTAFKTFARQHVVGYGGRFRAWAHSDETHPYNSWGNGGAMRVSPVGFAFDSEPTVLAEAERSAAVTHNHPEGIKGAQATALAIYLARNGAEKDHIKQQLSARFDYDLDRTLADIRPVYRFDVSSQGSVPESIIAFLESTDYESAVRNAISLGGDADTMACIAGGIAQAFYGPLPSPIVQQTRQRLPEPFLILLDRFNQRYGLP